jgi:ATP-binding cassette subfamily F protein uup
MLSSYPGTVLVASHDRDFLDRVVTSVLRAEGDGRFVEYAGGYSDMLAQLPKTAEIRSSPSPKRKHPSAVAARPRTERPKPQRRLSFHEQHALKVLPGEIATLESEIAALHDRLAHPGLYARDPDAFAAASARLATCEAALAQAEERWLELAVLQDELAKD